MAETARDLIARADHHRATVQACEWARTKIRLYDRPVVNRGFFGFLKDRETDRQMQFTGEEIGAIYDALAIVRDNAKRAADELDKRVTTTEATS